MKSLLLTLLFTITLSAQSYTYLIEQYNEVTDLEAKIISKVTKAVLKDKKVKIYIPNMKESDKKVYSKLFVITDNCNDADFIFVKYKNSNLSCDSKTKKYFFTNNYRKLLNNQNYIGAFFWSKSRPNIVFLKKRLDKNHIKLAAEYNQFIEE